MSISDRDSIHITEMILPTATEIRKDKREVKGEETSPLHALTFSGHALAQQTVRLALS